MVACHWAEQIRAGEIEPRYVDTAEAEAPVAAAAADPA
jgi:hypothetical protein